MASTCVLCYIWNPVQVISNHRYHAYYTWTIGFTMHDFLQVVLTVNLAVKRVRKEGYHAVILPTKTVVTYCMLFPNA